MNELGSSVLFAGGQGSLFFFFNQGELARENELNNFPFFCMLWKNSQKIAVNFPLSFDRGDHQNDLVLDISESLEF